jgi:hypothetical protein
LRIRLIPIITPNITTIGTTQGTDSALEAKCAPFNEAARLHVAKLWARFCSVGSDF